MYLVYEWGYFFQEVGRFWDISAYIPKDYSAS